jgi:HAD superfamily hydrolase (TIGR01509 family)
MKQNFCALFDMDGVLIDTETQYDVLWRRLSKKYHSGLDNFEKIVKGTTLPNILSTYFSHLTEEASIALVDEILAFEANMTFPEIAGVSEFVRKLKENSIPIGMVTSSDDTKLTAVYKEIDFREIFDTIVSANRIAAGKPDPMCYLLAAQDLGYEPKDCFVFEDSFAGIEAGNRAGMTVIGLATTYPKEALEDKCAKVIPDFVNFSMKDMKAHILALSEKS